MIVLAVTFRERCIVVAFALLVIFNVYETVNVKKPSIFGHVYESTKDEKPKQTTERDNASGNLGRKLSNMKKEYFLHKYFTSQNLSDITSAAEKQQNKSTIKPEVRHIAFLKVHKAASTTVQNILFRFGYRRRLSFVFPKEGHYFSKSTKKHLPLIPPKRNGTYDIICDHGFFNYSIYSSLLPKDTVYIAIVREPWNLFVSAFNFYLSVYHFRYLENIPKNKLENLIMYPEKYEEGTLSYTMNSMARDFGFTLDHLDDGDVQTLIKFTKEYLHKLGSIFDFVLIMEHFDESLIIMKKRLGWSLKDIIYIPKNVHSSGDNISKELMIKFRERNYLDYLIYDYFLEKFKEEKKRYGETLQAETDNLRAVLVKVRNWCSDEYFGELLIEATAWNEQFVLTSTDCSLMAKHSLDFAEILRKRQQNMNKRESKIQYKGKKRASE